MRIDPENPSILAILILTMTAHQSRRIRRCPNYSGAMMRQISAGGQAAAPTAAWAFMKRRACSTASSMCSWLSFQG